MKIQYKPQSKNCLYCGDVFVAINPSQYFCSLYCRFWSKVKFGEPQKCWAWKGFKNNQGYGVFRLTQLKKAHRVAYQIVYGLIPNDLLILHKCDNPSCVNPNHLYIGTHQDNTNDKMRKNRQSKLPGILNGRSKLVPQEINLIRKLYKNHAYNQTQLGKIFNVSQVQISYIVLKKSWAHI